MMEEFSGPSGMDKLFETDIADICIPVNELYSCLSEQLQECIGIEEPPIPSFFTTLQIIRVILDFVCVENIDVINRHKSCLLIESPQHDNLPLISLSVAQHCSQYMNPVPGASVEHCFSREMQLCVKTVVANQCGNEIAYVVNDLATRVRQIAKCDSAQQLPYQRRSNGKIDKAHYLQSVFKRLKTF
jgi:hypothetical protein